MRNTTEVIMNVLTDNAIAIFLSSLKKAPIHSILQE